MSQALTRDSAAGEVRWDAVALSIHEARDSLAERLRRAQAIDLRKVKRGKYFRLVAEVIADGENMSDLLLARGLARPCDGGARERTICAGMAGQGGSGLTT